MWRIFFLIGILFSGCSYIKGPVVDSSQYYRLTKENDGTLTAEICVVRGSQKASIKLLNATDEDDESRTYVTKVGVFFTIRGETIEAKMGEEVIADKSSPKLVVSRKFATTK